MSKLSKNKRQWFIDRLREWDDNVDTATANSAIDKYYPRLEGIGKYYQLGYLKFFIVRELE